MLDVSLEQTRFYQDAKAEGWREGWKKGWEEGWKQGWKQGQEEKQVEMLRVIVPILLKAGMSLEEIAQRLPVEIDAVRLAAQQSE
ncbi:MAG: Rpn family recombination-promoting nuclease/putative transposase [Nostocaceae cyanobacterium]|nr:Rpn family recombination-promoting nuclease/putative transposase [Nostocaceae cyanobacterium]